MYQKILLNFPHLKNAWVIEFANGIFANLRQTLISFKEYIYIYVYY